VVLPMRRRSCTSPGFIRTVSFLRWPAMSTR
jgi:hypothetical protein